jgi:hypothetical protein
LRSSPAADSAKEEQVGRQQPDEKAKDPRQERRKNSVVEERKRGQRLFGGLLSTLSQSTSNGQQKRRLEIEKRQAEKAKQQKQDEEVRKAEKLASLKKIRKAEQVKFDEESVSRSGSISLRHVLKNRCRCGYGILICCSWPIFFPRKQNPNL